MVEERNWCNVPWKVYTIPVRYLWAILPVSMLLLFNSHWFFSTLTIPPIGNPDTVAMAFTTIAMASYLFTCELGIRKKKDVYDEVFSILGEAVRNNRLYDLLLQLLQEQALEHYNHL